MDISLAVTLVSMNLWVFLLLLSIGVLWALVSYFKPTNAKLLQMLKMGLFLAVFDLVFETIGLYVGYWHVQNSIFLLGPAVPLEVFLIATCAGATLSLLFPKFSMQASLSSAFLIAGAGTWIEAMLVNAGNLVYTSGWTSFHAFIAYFAVFYFLQYVNTALFTQRAAVAKKRKR
ncbi:MAG: hypothetical protein V1644_03650 [Candidatus Micrarchaeota archaeon]